MTGHCSNTNTSCYLFVVLGPYTYQICSYGEMHVTLHNSILHKYKVHHVKEHPRFDHTVYSNFLFYPITVEVWILKSTTSSLSKHNSYQIARPKHLGVFYGNTMEENRPDTACNQHPSQHLPTLNAATTPLCGGLVGQ